MVRKINPIFYIIIPVFFFLLAGMGLLLKLYLNSQNQLNQLQLQAGLDGAAPTPTADEIKRLVAQVGKHFLLPANEIPHAITLANVDTLKKDQPFFTNAKNGNILLVYSQEVILYDPILDKVINVAQIRVAPSQTPQASDKNAVTPVSSESSSLNSNLPVSPTTAKIKISVLNGTNSPPALSKMKNLISQIPQLEIVDTADASRQNYENTLLINLKGLNQKTASDLATALSASVSTMPQNEAPPSPDSDILIIIGANME
ncbi:hypothetical protein M1271_06110 [Patescibacteria group bacterium]|nr:hypothetical protein [Patescibacteria group bacterium]MCL5797410.1 hypothetical protein [Patescibacteria group bacterium]